ncbi:MAG: hypothetical protein HOP08_17955 [Cyclobacteriaceae bacterium]|nr:hypothetical protein [Cyclobacteriaceae bacterium]
MAIQKRVIVCPLDWGLGHATRCVPVIRELTKRGAQVFIASSGGALELLRQEFPQLVFFEFPSYDPVYQGKGSMSFSMILQLPKFRKVIEEEHVVLERLIQENKIDIVISDNRYGCWTSSVKSVFITHQVNLLMPKGFIWMSPGVNHLLHQYIKKFSQVWIPDMPEAELTKPFTSRSVPNQKYIGWLSRFEGSRPVKQQFDILALVSGRNPSDPCLRK